MHASLDWEVTGLSTLHVFVELQGRYLGLLIVLWLLRDYLWILVQCVGTFLDFVWTALVLLRSFLEWFWERRFPVSIPSSPLEQLG